MDISEADEIVTRLYQELLGRPASTDKAGKWGKMQSLMGGMSEDDVRVAMMNSKEYKDKQGIATSTITIMADANGKQKSQNDNINKVFRNAVSKAPRTTIVVVTSNIMGDLFPRCMANIKKHTRREYQIIVVESHFIEDMYNLARDMNIGLRVPDSEYYVSMNDDIFVNEGWLDALIEPTLMDKKVGIVGGLYLFPDKKTIQHGGIFFNRNNNPSHRYYNQNIDITPDAKKQCYLPAVTGALVLITRDCLRDVGLWDQELFSVSYNDPDYCLRAWMKGWKVFYTPNCTAIHLQGQTVQGAIHKRATEVCGTNFNNKWGAAQITNVVALVDQENKK